MIRDSWRIHSASYSIALPVLALLLVLGAAFVPTAQADAAQQETARQAVQATSTAIALAAPTVAAQQTAAAAATQTSESADSQATATAYAAATARAAATAQSLGTAAAVIQLTQQARDVDTRVQISIAATQAAVPSATPVPPTPVVVYVPVPVPAPVGSAPQYVLNAINGSNKAYAVAKWSLNPNDLVGHIVGRELSDGQAYVRDLIQRRTRVRSTLVSGAVTSWSLVSATRVIATTSETWRFSNYDADQYTLKNDVGARVYRNVYTIDYTTYYGWVVSLDDVPNPNGDPA